MKTMLNKKILMLVFLLVFLTLLVGCYTSPAPPITENQVPVITSTPVTTAKVGVTYTYDVDATDPNDDTLAYSLTTYPSGMAINPANGLIWWIPTSAQVGNNAVIVEVSDGVLSDIQGFTIKVSAVEPGLTGIVVIPKTMTLIEGESKTITSVTAKYSVGSTANIALKNCSYESSHKEFATVTNTGLVTAIAPPSATITVSYTEEGITKTDKIIVTVSAVNHFPVITSTPGDIAIVGEAYTYEVKATDPDGDVLTYSLITKPDGMVIDSGTGVISWTPTEGQVGVGNFTVKVSDEQLSDTQTFGIIVKANELTGIKVSPDTMAFSVIGGSQTFTVSAEYSDGTSKDVTSGCTYLSSDDSIATVFPGEVITFGYGTANIIITYAPIPEIFFTAITVTVTDPITEPVPLSTPLTKDGITVTMEKIEQVGPPLCVQLFGFETYFSVINSSERILKSGILGPATGSLFYVLDEEIYEDEFNTIGYNHIGDATSWVYPGQSRSVGYRKCFHSPITIKQITWTGTFADDQTEIELGPWKN